MQALYWQAAVMGSVVLVHVFASRSCALGVSYRVSSEQIDLAALFDTAAARHLLERTLLPSQSDIAHSMARRYAREATA